MNDLPRPATARAVLAVVTLSLLAMASAGAAMVACNDVVVDNDGVPALPNVTTHNCGNNSPGPSSGILKYFYTGLPTGVTATMACFNDPVYQPGDSAGNPTASNEIAPDPDKIDGRWDAATQSLGMYDIWSPDLFGAMKNSAGYWWNDSTQSLSDLGLPDDFPQSEELKTRYGYWVKTSKNLGLVAPSASASP